MLKKDQKKVQIYIAGREPGAIGLLRRGVLSALPSVIRLVAGDYDNMFIIMAKTRNGGYLVDLAPNVRVKKEIRKTPEPEAAKRIGFL